MVVRRLPEITAEQEGFRVVEVHPGLSTIRRDPVEPVPVGTFVARVFKVVGYDPDCDGSLMARLAAVDVGGKETGWTQSGIGLYPESAWVLDGPADLDPADLPCADLPCAETLGGA